MKTQNKSLGLSDMYGSITHPKNDGNVVSNRVKETIRYNINGEGDKSKKRKFDDVETCAVELTTGKNKIYRVKAKRGGQLFNPLKSGFTYGLHVVDKTNNEPMFQFKEVNEKAFKNYVSFLQKRHDTLLFAAERES